MEAMTKRTPTWILVANRARASLFERRGKANKWIVHLRTIEHPEGRLRDRAMNSDKSGRTFPRHGTGSSPLEKSHDPVEQEARRFAHVIASVLTEEAARNSFGKLVVVAEPRFLGRLREALGHSTRARIALTVPKDIAEIGVHEIQSEIDEILGGDDRLAMG